jgi:hypothetical protein
VTLIISSRAAGITRVNFFTYRAFNWLAIPISLAVRTN